MMGGDAPAALMLSLQGHLEMMMETVMMEMYQY
jgi:hypothetical protein